MSDWIGPRYTLALGVTLQAVFGFIMAGAYEKLAQPDVVAAFAVVYGMYVLEPPLLLLALPFLHTHTHT